MYKPAFPPVRQLFVATALLVALAAPAQAENSYRAEIVVVERLTDPIISEKMAGKYPEMKEASKQLRVVDESGNVSSDIDTTDTLTLNTAASRLENSGKYRVLLKTGWVQDFPPEYDGEPLRIEVGEFLERAGHRALEGTIEINRRRYLLVDVELNHWRGTGSATMPKTTDGASDETADTPGEAEGDETDTSALPPSDDDTLPESTPEVATKAGKELITWIRETRRMRSEEIHFLDSPTIGVLVYFRPMDQEETESGAQ